MSTKFTDDEWLLIFQQRTQSGLSVRKWCDSNQIKSQPYGLTTGSAGGLDEPLRGIFRYRL